MRSHRVSAGAALATCAQVFAQQPQVSPKLSECEIRIGDEVIKSVRGPVEYADEHIVNGRRVAVTKGRVTGTRPNTEDQAWECSSPDNRELRWLGSEGDEAFFTVHAGRLERNYDKPARVRVLDLTNGTWRDPIALDRPGVVGVEIVTAVLPIDDELVVLTHVMSGSDRDAQLQGYRVTRFGVDRSKVIWGMDFTASKLGAHRSKTYLWSATRPTETFPDVQPLTAIGKDILVCAGSREPVLCLNGASGGEQWKIDRPWEFQRGFIGPSVWSHHIARFGDHMLDFAQDEPSLAGPRKAFDSKYVCSIVGGPVVVTVPPPLSSWAPPEPDHRVFIAVSRAGVGEWPEYLADCVVYEFSHGRALSMVQVPSMIVGGSFSVHKDRVAWATQDDGIGCFAPSPQSLFGSMGPGGPNMIGRMPWYRQVSAPVVQAWLSTDRATERTAMSGHFAFRLAAGGYESKRGDGFFNFPLSVVDLGTGAETVAAIRVPYRGELKEPTSNIGFTTLPDGTRTNFFSRGPAVLAVTWLDVVGESLRVFASAEGSESVSVVDFKVADIEKGAKAGR
jgi:hypothetical protein